MQRSFKRALRYFDLAIEKNPDDERPWNNKGIVYRNMGNIKESRRCFERALKIKPNNAVIRRNLKSLEKPIASGTPAYSLGFSNTLKKIVPMLK